MASSSKSPPAIQLRSTTAWVSSSSSSGTAIASSRTDTDTTANPWTIEDDEAEGDVDGVFQQQQQQSGRNEFPLLPPVDGGKDAWLFLAACFVLEALVWGFPFAFGIFQSYYSITAPFAGANNIAIIGTCATGIMYLDAPIIVYLLRRYPKPARWASIVGLLAMCAALALSSLATTVPQLIVTQGILYALGGSVAYSPCIIYLDEWFVKRKGLAYGIMWSGTGLGGVVLPILLEHLLSSYGFQTTLRLFGGLMFALSAPLAWFIKPRLPIRPFNTNYNNSDNEENHHTLSGGTSVNLNFVLSRPFLLYQLANIVEATGYFLPAIYLPSYARSAIGASPFPSALTLLLLNVASVFGCVAMGSLIDRIHVTTCILVSTLGTVAGTFLLWGFSASLPLLYVFCIVYGLFAGSFTSAWPGIMREVARQQREEREDGDGSGGDNAKAPADPTMVFAFLALGRGVGNMVSGPLSEALMRDAPWRGQAFGGYGSGYGGLIAFTGATALFGGGSYAWRKLGWL
ncbi:major facilitator superfamily domain-containing protein [Bombardia bombarda]|uniref:Major facilitator superfamily domain-containing protein n=1 Tax=Bombardia bombarda TaxID=252184 RepID=A0AA40CA55_9PEZI|nr:major facilitator superfamily domain-containing protein [Bombardia bombarda]